MKRDIADTASDDREVGWWVNLASAELNAEVGRNRFQHKPNRLMRPTGLVSDEITTMVKIASAVIGLLLVGLTSAYGGLWLLSRIARRYGTDETPMGRYHYRYKNSDEQLRKRTEHRRQDAETIRRQARQLETKDDRASRIHVVH